MDKLPDDILLIIFGYLPFDKIDACLSYSNVATKILKKAYYKQCAIDKSSIAVIYRIDGLLWRPDGPAIEYVNGPKFWYKNNKLHRLDGPAIEYPNGYKAWYINDKRHRGDGPAIIEANGSEYWYKNNKLHRANGPAIEHANGNKIWYLHGKKITYL